MKRIIGVAALMCAFVAVTAVPASATHSWGGYHWARTSNPFTVKVGDNLTNGWNTYLAKASSDWNVSTVAKNTVVPGQAKGRCRPTSGRDEVCNDTYGANGWLGLASIWLSGGHIAQGTVKVNDTYFNTSTYNNPNEKQHVMCQEVGHTWGLDHQDTSGASLNTCMDYFSNTGSNATSTASTTPNQHDYDELGIIYSHLDSTTTIGAAVGAGAAASAIPSWANPSESVYVDQLANGMTQVTYVRWANPIHGWAG